MLIISLILKSIYGDLKTISASPWMNQQCDFSVCAHVAVWSIVKYYSNEYSEYRDIDIGELVDFIPASNEPSGHAGM